jgi:hypothetical protein
MNNQPFLCVVTYERSRIFSKMSGNMKHHDCVPHRKLKSENFKFFPLTFPQDIIKVSLNILLFKFIVVFRAGIMDKQQKAGN